MGTNTPTVSKTAEVLPPPTERYSIVRWLHKNLFSTWYNALLTVVMLFLAALIVRGVLEWAFTQARRSAPFPTSPRPPRAGGRPRRRRRPR